MQGDAFEARLRQIAEHHRRFRERVLNLFTQQVEAVDARVRVLEGLLAIEEASPQPEFSFCARGELLARLDAVAERVAEREQARAEQQRQLGEVGAELLALQRRCACLNQLHPSR